MRKALHVALSVLCSNCTTAGVTQTPPPAPPASMAAAAPPSPPPPSAAPIAPQIAPPIPAEPETSLLEPSEPGSLVVRSEPGFDAVRKGKPLKGGAHGPAVLIVQTM